MARSDETPRDLLFGLLALHTGLIDQDQLLAAFGGWSRSKGKTLAEILVERGAIDAESRALLAAMAEKQLKLHGGDTEKSLAAVVAGHGASQGLASLGDSELPESLASIVAPGGSRDALATMTYGVATSEGQRFRVLRPHARGGLGEVFVAVDQELHREVALKQILNQHADDPASRARFLLEAEVTGGLEHPGIVPVYGLGRYGDGRPYYAMRFVRGDTLKEAITTFHDDASLKANPGRRSLELRKLLRRFIDVCNAIDYAHSRGGLHRDIKPRNIIVGRHGETLVVDWGLAKVTGKSEPGAGERTLLPSGSGGSSETLPGSALGTPSYMSPEQARGEVEELGPRSDVYSLGATLYCLLTGQPPREGDDVGEILRQTQRGDFPRPGQIDPSIDRALEAVCLKAMALQPADRYASPRTLAEDVERWMADEPVSAWREPWTRRGLRWLTRHRTGVTAAAAAVLVGVVGLSAVLAVQSVANARLSQSLKRETAANAALASANAELKNSKAAVQARYDLAVDAIKTFHTGVSEDFLLKENQFKELRDRLLKSASDFYGKLGGMLGKETDFASRRSLAQANFELAELTSKIGRKEDALKAHQAVLATRQALAVEPGADDSMRAEVGRSLTEVAALLDSTGQGAESIATYRRAESMLIPPAATDQKARAALAACRSRMALELFYAGKPSDSLTSLRLARADQEKEVASPGASIDTRRELAETITLIGYVL